MPLLFISISSIMHHNADICSRKPKQYQSRVSLSLNKAQRAFNNSVKSNNKESADNSCSQSWFVKVALSYDTVYIQK